MRRDIIRPVVAFLLSISVLGGMAYARTPEHGAPTMTPNAAPAPRGGSAPEVVIPRATPSARPGVP